MALQGNIQHPTFKAEVFYATILGSWALNVVGRPSLGG
jgi:hypothetical protein